MQFSVFGDSGLNEQGSSTRRHAGCQPVSNHVPDAVFDNVGIFVMRGQGVPVGDEKETFKLVLQLDPVMDDAIQMSQMQTSGWAHARNHAPLRINGTQNLLPGKTTCLLM